MTIQRRAVAWTGRYGRHCCDQKEVCCWLLRLISRAVPLHATAAAAAPCGCVQVEEQERVLRWGDYEGNFMFNTLGALLGTQTRIVEGTGLV